MENDKKILSKTGSLRGLFAEKESTNQLLQSVDEILPKGLMQSKASKKEGVWYSTIFLGFISLYVVCLSLFYLASTSGQLSQSTIYISAFCVLSIPLGIFMAMGGLSSGHEILHGASYPMNQPSTRQFLPIS